MQGPLHGCCFLLYMKITTCTPTQSLGKFYFQIHLWTYVKHLGDTLLVLVNIDFTIGLYILIINTIDNCCAYI